MRKSQVPRWQNCEVLHLRKPARGARERPTEQRSAKIWISCEQNTERRAGEKLFCGQGGFDGLGHLIGIRRDFGIKTVQDFAVAADQKLGEVPADISGKRRSVARQ